MNNHLSIRPEVEELLRLTGIQDWDSKCSQIAYDLQGDFGRALKNLLELDRSIPGLGQHNVNERALDGHLTGVYNHEDRPIFRGIQYVGMHLNTDKPEWYTRMIVTESCYHVEGCLKRKTGITGNLSVGMILNEIKGRTTLADDLVTALWHLNRAIYNNAKHAIEFIEMDGHMFSIADCIAIYLACRVIGARLLNGLGITTKHGELLFP